MIGYDNAMQIYERQGRTNDEKEQVRNGQVNNEVLRG
jgi:hypothetical protein